VCCHIEPTKFFDSVLSHLDRQALMHNAQAHKGYFQVGEVARKIWKEEVRAVETVVEI
jgi:hypothetical protein